MASSGGAGLSGGQNNPISLEDLLQNQEQPTHDEALLWPQRAPIVVHYSAGADNPLNGMLGIVDGSDGRP